MVTIYSACRSFLGYLKQFVVETKHADAAYLVLENKGRVFLRQAGSKLTVKILKPNKALVPLDVPRKQNALSEMSAIIKKKYGSTKKNLSARIIIWISVGLCVIHFTKYIWVDIYIGDLLNLSGFFHLIYFQIKYLWSNIITRLRYV